MAARNQNTLRQPNAGPRKPPTRGAIAGAMEEMPISVEKALADALPFKRSGTTARARTTVEPPANPWNRRIAISVPIFGAIAQRIDEPKNTKVAMRSNFLRPKLSERAPMTSCPAAIPIMKVARVS